MVKPLDFVISVQIFDHFRVTFGLKKFWSLFTAEILDRFGSIFLKKNFLVTFYCVKQTKKSEKKNAKFPVNFDRPSVRVSHLFCQKTLFFTTKNLKKKLGSNYEKIFF